MRSWLIVLVFIGVVVALSAHEKFKIVGKIAGLKKDEIAVKAIDGATYEIDMHDDTPVTDKQHKKIAHDQLKAGANVVILALGHDMFDLEAYEIQLVDR
jgi:hypothetical protein